MISTGGLAASCGMAATKPIKTAKTNTCVCVVVWEINVASTLDQKIISEISERKKRWAELTFIVRMLVMMCDARLFSTCRFIHSGKKWWAPPWECLRESLFFLFCCLSAYWRGRNQPAEEEEKKNQFSLKDCLLFLVNTFHHLVVLHFNPPPRLSLQQFLPFYTRRFTTKLSILLEKKKGEEDDERWRVSISSSRRSVIM